MRLPDGSVGLVEYVRDSQRRIIGAVIAVGSGHIGWSLCHPRQNLFNKRNKQIAITAAAGRARIGTRAIPPDYRAAQIDEIMERMTIRSYSYFKEEPVCGISCGCDKDPQYNDANKAFLTY